MPVIPRTDLVGDDVVTEAADDVDGEVIKNDEIAMEEKIVGVESVTWDKHGPGARSANPLPTPQTPTQAQIERHNLTHLPYQPWCPFCVACRRKNTHHRPSHEREREIPLLVGDYAFPKTTEDLEGPKMLVLRVYPYKMVFACVVDVKGPDPVVVDRVVKFLRDCGLVHFAYRANREATIGSFD